MARVADYERLLVECLPTSHQTSISTDVCERLRNDRCNVFDVGLLQFCQLAGSTKDGLEVTGLIAAFEFEVG